MMYVSYVELVFHCSEKIFQEVDEEIQDLKEQNKGFDDIYLDWSEEDHGGVVSIADPEVSGDFDQQIIALAELVGAHGSILEGYYVTDVDTDVVRVDVDYDYDYKPQLYFAGTRWLLDYTVEQIEALQKIAREKFPEQSTDRSDSYEAD